MKAITFHGKHNLRFETMPDPQLKALTDVVVKVKLCAICGSDLHVYHENEKGCDHGTAMGHEFMGEVVDVGKEVRSLKKGDRVMSPFSTSCGQCFYCRKGLTSRCVFSQLFGWVEKGRGLNGGQAEFVRVPIAENTLMKIPDGMNDEQALLLGDIIPTGYFCAMQAEIKPKETYAVIGCGPVGLMAIIGARELGAEKIFAIDTVDYRLEMAKQLGAVPVNAAKSNTVELLRTMTENRGADAVMEAVGNKVTGRLAYDLVRPGGIISMVGVCTDANFPFSPADVYNKNLTIKVGRCPARMLMDRLIPLVRSGKYDFTSVITHRLSLADGIRAYETFANKTDNCLKVILSPAG